ncbi:MAG: hypothetical protein E7478_05360 [Ruminococcaceae bacterium]|nr:hypothetical protein [Oscillospiraceae bacterium]
MKERHNTYYDSITPESSDAEFLKGVLRKAENMDTINKKRTSKRPVLIACAAALTLCVGVSAAAATGLLRFEDIFGDRLVAESEQLGYELIGEAHDVVITCSDNSYSVTLHGVTGSANDILAGIEISRKDGTPISELILADSDLVCPTVADVSWSSDGKDAHAMGYSIGYTETGSVMFTADMMMTFDDFSSEDVLTGKRINMAFSQFGVDTLEHPFDFSIEFTYLPTEKALEKLAAADLSEPCEILYNISATGDGVLPTGKDIPLETILTSIDIRPEKGMLSGKIIPEGYTWDDYNINTFRTNNDISLIRADGTAFPVTLGGFQMNNDGEYYSFTMNIEYHEMNEVTDKAVDLATVEAISFNGTVYDLN